MKPLYISFLLTTSLSNIYFTGEAQTRNIDPVYSQINQKTSPGQKMSSNQSAPAGSAVDSSDSAASHAKKHSYVEAGLSYQNENVFLGRKDSARLPYIIPAITYYYKSGLYFSASAAWLKDANDDRIDVVTMAGGYTFSAGNYFGDFSASKFFYNNQSTSVTSGITASITYQHDYDFGFIKPTSIVTLDFGSHIDLEGSLGLEHTFETMNDHLDITPSFIANASTLNYYNNYIEQKKFKKRSGQKTVTGTENITGTMMNASNFRVMDYECSLPVSYSAGRFTFNCTPTYALPVHAAIIQEHTTYPVGLPTTGTTVEALKNTLYYTAGLTYKL